MKPFTTGHPSIGTFQIFDSLQITESLGVAGIDFVVFDQEHSSLTASDTLPLCVAAENANMVPVIRVRSNLPSEIQRALDLGGGVQIPQIETIEDAKAAVDASRFDPIGHRGLSQYNRAGKYAGMDEYTKLQNESQLVVLQIEGKSGIENASEIIRVPGFDVLFVGPYDLSQSLGIPGEITHPDVTDAIESVVELGEKSNVAIGGFADDVAMANDLINLGMKYITLAVDAPLFVKSVEDQLNQIRKG